MPLRVCVAVSSSIQCKLLLSEIVERKQLVRMLIRIKRRVPILSNRQLWINADIYDVSNDEALYNAESDLRRKAFVRARTIAKKGLEEIYHGKLMKAEQTFARLNGAYPGVFDAQVVLRELKEARRSRKGVKRFGPYLRYIMSSGPEDYLKNTNNVRFQ